MSKVKYRTIQDGPIPGEKAVTVLTADGIEEEVIVPNEQAQGGYLTVWPIATESDRVLVELPRESSSGSWRLWLSRNGVESAA